MKKINRTKMYRITAPLKRSFIYLNNVQQVPRSKPSVVLLSSRITLVIP